MKAEVEGGSLQGSWGGGGVTLGGLERPAGLELGGRGSRVRCGAGPPGHMWTALYCILDTECKDCRLAETMIRFSASVTGF